MTFTRISRTIKPTSTTTIMMPLIFHIVVFVLVSLIVCNSGHVSSVVIPTETVSSTTNNHQGSPFWKRPGCHKVGHTRTIAIPGCVKFDLTTNACRGYCLSYSIPSIEDIGPPPLSSSSGGGQANSLTTQLLIGGAGGIGVLDNSGQMMSGSSRIHLVDYTSLNKNSNNADGISNNNNNLNNDNENSDSNINNNDNKNHRLHHNNDLHKASFRPEHLESILSTLSTIPSTKNQTYDGTNMLLSEQLHHHMLALQHQKQRLTNDNINNNNPSVNHNTNSNNFGSINSDHLSPQSMPIEAAINPDLITSTGPVEANLVPTGPKQDIISIGQCCNMMETEDIKVNVRCETGLRDFTFKSAKSCECFFCK